MKNIYTEYTTNIQSVVTAVHSADIIIVEGFESVGKQVFINKLATVLHRTIAFDFKQDVNIMTYRPEYYTLKYDQLLRNEDRFILRLPVIELFKQSIYSTDPDAKRQILIIDKAVFSDYVYMHTRDTLSVDNVRQMFEAYHLQWKDLKVAVIHMTFDLEQMLKSDFPAQPKFGSTLQYLAKCCEADSLFYVAFEKYCEMFNDQITFIKYHNTLETESNE